MPSEKNEMLERKKIRFIVALKKKMIHNMCFVWIFQQSFFRCREEDKPAILLYILKHVIDLDQLTVVFAATKHHVEYLHMVWFSDIYFSEFNDQGVFSPIQIF